MTSLVEEIIEWAKIVGLVIVGVYAVLLIGAGLFFILPKLAKTSWNLITKSAPIVFGFFWLICVGGGMIWLKEQPWISENKDGADWVRSAGFFLLGAGIAPLGLWLAHRRTSYLWEQTKNESLRRVTDAFTKSVELLGHRDITVRQGGIYALGRLARENIGERSKILDILAAYIRQRSKDRYYKCVREMVNALSESDKMDDATAHLSKEAMPIDLDAAIAVIRDLTPLRDEEPRRLDLSNAFLYNADFNCVVLDGANLSDSQFLGCVFAGANLKGANLVNSNFANSDLHDARLDGAILRGAKFDDADLSGANLSGAEVAGIDFSEANNFTESQLSGTNGDGRTKPPSGKVARLKAWMKSRSK